MDRLEIKKGIFQDDIRRHIRIHIQIQYELGFESFLQANYLADEIFYINYIDKHQKEIIAEYEKIVNFHDISEGEKITPDKEDQWYEEKTTRDHYWYYKEYQSFLKERLAELEKIKELKERKKPDLNITKLIDDFEIFSKNFENEIKILFNDKISKKEKLDIYFKDHLPMYLKRINGIVSQIELMQSEFELYFPNLKTDLQKLNAPLSKFKKGIFNTLETSLESVIKSDFDRLLFEYLHITNKLETELKIEGKNISDLFKLFYERLQYIKLNPKPQQPEADTSTVIKESFINKFDKVSETILIQYFKQNLVEKKYLTEIELNKYLKQAFELKTPPDTKYSFNNIDSIENIVNIFYKYYKDVTTESTYGRQKEYFNLLKDYFNGFEKIHLKNFSK